MGGECITQSTPTRDHRIKNPIETLLLPERLHILAYLTYLHVLICLKTPAKPSTKHLGLPLPNPKLPIAFVQRMFSNSGPRSAGNKAPRMEAVARPCIIGIAGGCAKFMAWKQFLQYID
jgi:hypothetical protein